MKLIENWRRVMLRAWSMRLMLAAMVIALADALPAVGTVVPGWLSTVLVLGAAVARVVQQDSVKA
jgi:hypothetical protein